MIVEDFSLIPMGPFSDPAWRASPAGFAPTIVAVPTSVDRSLRVQVASDGAAVAACRDLEPALPRITVDTILRVDGDQGAGPLLAVGIRQGAVRLGRDRGQRLTLGDSETTGATDLRIMPGDWYRLIVDVDPESGTYRLDAEAVDRPAARVRREGLALGRPSAATEGICYTASGAAGASVTIDEIRITAR